MDPSADNSNFSLQSNRSSRRDFLKYAAMGLATAAAPRLVFCGETKPSTTDGMPVPVDGAHSFIVLPDTQVYAMSFPELFHAQTEWIVKNRKRYNIQFVLHAGDVVQHNNHPQWKLARAAMSRLDGNVPYAICLGNHDLGPKGSTKNRDSYFGNHFPLDFWKKQPTFGGVYDREPQKPDNSFHLFSTGDDRWLVLALEFAPRDDVLRWAGEVVAAYPNHQAILLTHAYLNKDGKRYDHTKKGQTAPPHHYPCFKSEAGCNDGQMMWEKLVSKHPNFAMVFCGHVCTAARLGSTGQNGNQVNQFLVDYQNHPNGGDSWLRLCQLADASPSQKIQSTDYAPKLGKRGAADNTNFCIDL